MNERLRLAGRFAAQLCGALQPRGGIWTTKFCSKEVVTSRKSSLRNACLTSAFCILAAAFPRALNLHRFSCKRRAGDAACTPRCTCRADPRSRGAALRLRGGAWKGARRPRGHNGRVRGGGLRAVGVGAAEAGRRGRLSVAAVPEEQPGMVRPLSVFWQRRLLDL